mmetsp:Transcript_7613/g.6900  ORF Transcript_7613/g.6900 Transcript_7613/m.6900 type:complete len:141 (-) Transcript_7613:426-848(-)
MSFKEANNQNNALMNKGQGPSLNSLQLDDLPRPGGSIVVDEPKSFTKMLRSNDDLDSTSTRSFANFRKLTVETPLKKPENRSRFGSMNNKSIVNVSTRIGTTLDMGKSSDLKPLLGPALIVDDDALSLSAVSNMLNQLNC